MTSQAVSLPSPTVVTSGMILREGSNPGLGERIVQDLAGNTLAVIVLLSMLFSVASALRFLRPSPVTIANNLPSGWIPFLCLAGIGIAGYLSYIEMTQMEAVCGPTGCLYA